jgi:AraC-like DNA-binding protein
MAVTVIEYSSEFSRYEEEKWRHEIEKQCAMKCVPEPEKNSSSWSRTWCLGEVGLLDACVAFQTWSPVDGKRYPSREDSVFVKIVTGGSLVILQHNEEITVPAGGVVTVDPTWPYTQYFSSATRLIGLKLPRQALKARGYPYESHRVVAPDLLSADVIFLRNLLIHVAEQKDLPSAAFREKMGEQTLDMMDVLLQNPTAHRASGRSEVILLRAKAIIARRLGDSRLDIDQIAAELHTSASHLSKLFRTEGTTIMRYVLQKRLDRAHSLIKQFVPFRAQIQEIAYMCGFESPSHFSRTFKARFGFSPREAIEV